MARIKRVRIIKKIRVSPGVWKFISLQKNGNRYLWDDREGVYYLEWWEGLSRKRESVGTTPSQAREAQSRKQHELMGRGVAGGKVYDTETEETHATPFSDSRKAFLEHVEIHSPDKPKTRQRYAKVLEHFETHVGSDRAIESITRRDIDEYKTVRSRAYSQQHPNRRITPRTINFEVSVLRTFFYFLINEREVRIENPCTRFKALRDSKAKALRRPPTYSRDELNRLFAECDPFERTVFATLLLTGLREQELCFLQWSDVQLTGKNPTIRVTGKEGFSPKDYEERAVPIPSDLATLLKALPRSGDWVFPTSKGKRQTHLLRRLNTVAKRADISGATLHKFRHTYATNLLEAGCDVVTVQKLMGHSDIDTTRQYLNPDDTLKRAAVDRLSFSG